MKKYGIGILTGVILGISSIMFLGSSSGVADRYEYISGSTVDLKIFDKRTGKIWLNSEMVNWSDAKIHILSHGLLYASCVFEGERVYDGEIFKL